MLEVTQKTDHDKDTIAQQWLAFTNKNVRDLAYALACPPVLLDIPNCIQAELANGQQSLPKNLELPNTEFWQTHFQNYLPRLHELEKDATPLDQFLTNNVASTRLGFRFEGLLLFWLSDSDYHHYELLAHSVQVFEGKITLGELDFIVRNTKNNDIEHWEVAIKFLLGEPPFTPSCWKGLKGSDNLYKKVTHMLTKSLQYDSVQLNIESTTVQTQTWKIDKRLLILKGRFFEPVHIQQSKTAKTPQITPSWLNPSLPRGIWYNGIPHDANTQKWRMGARIEWFTQRACSADMVNQNTDDTNVFVWQTGLYFSDVSAYHNKENAVMLRLD